MAWAKIADEIVRTDGMKAKLTQYIVISATLVGWMGGLATGLGGCSTTEVVPQPAPSAGPPPYVQVPHPAGYDLGDLRAIFTDPSAPKMEALQECEADLNKLKSLTQSEDE